MKGASIRSWSALLIGFVAYPLLTVLAAAGVFGADGAMYVSDFGLTAVVMLCAVIGLAGLATIGIGSAIARPWLVILVALMSWGVGNAVWAYYEAGLGVEVPFPGLADVFYLATIPIALVGMVIALSGFARFMPVRAQVLSAAAMGLALAAILWFAVLAPTSTGVTGSDLTAAIVAAAYPLGDATLLAASLAVLFATRKLRGGLVAIPWYPLSLGWVAFAIADTLFAVLVYMEVYSTGGWIDIGWGAGAALVAFGASLLADIQASPAGGEAS